MKKLIGILAAITLSLGIPSYAKAEDLETRLNQIKTTYKLTEIESPVKKIGENIKYLQRFDAWARNNKDKITGNDLAMIIEGAGNCGACYKDSISYILFLDKKPEEKEYWEVDQYGIQFGFDSKKGHKGLIAFKSASYKEGMHFFVADVGSAGLDLKDDDTAGIAGNPPETILFFYEDNKVNKLWIKKKKESVDITNFGSPEDLDKTGVDQWNMLYADLLQKTVDLIGKRYNFQ